MNRPGAWLSRVLVTGLLSGLLLAGTGGGPAGLHAQPIAEQGRPFIRTYTGPDYGADPQNFDLVTGADGRLYVANERGVLVYDGEAWRLVPVTGRTAARSLAVGPADTVYVGGQGDIGRLVPDGAGGRRYASLRPRLPDSARGFSYVWATHAVGEAVYFGTQQRLIRWQKGRMKTWEGPFLLSFSVGDAVYTQRPGGPLLRIDGPALRPVPGTDRLPTIYFAVPHPDGGLLLGTRADGVFRSHNGRLSAWRPEAAARLAQAVPYTGAAFPDGRIVIGTRTRGLFLYDPDGTLRRHITRASGLLENLVYGLHLDDQGGVWAAQSQGLSRVETSHALSVYGADEGLSGNVMAVLRAGGTLYAATLKGLFALRPSERRGREARFDRLAVPGLVHDLVPAGDGVLAAATSGVYRVGAQGAERLNVLRKGEEAAVLSRRAQDAPRLYIGTWGEPGVVAARRTEAGWVRERTVRTPPLSRLIHGPAGALWGGTKSAPLLRISPTLDDWAAPAAAVARYDTSDGLPAMYANFPYRVQGRLVVGTVDGPYRLDAATGRFRPDTALRAPLPAPSQYVEPIAEDADGHVWMQLGATGTPVAGRLVPDGDRLAWRPGRLRRLSGFAAFDIYRDGAATWIGGPGLGPDALLVRHAPRRARPPSSAATGPAAHLRRVYLPTADSALALARNEPPQLAYAHNAVRFAFAAPAFDVPDATTYRTRLKGYDDAWSDWRSAPEATYTRLAPGRYVFHVQARDGYHRVGPPATLAFIVRPPWYQTGWAYALWGLLALLGGAGGVRARTWQLRRRQQRLEATVADRTDEVRRQRDQLEAQAEQLQELDRAKSRFFANISHEFRTPLTLILGPVRRVRDRLLHRSSSPSDKEAAAHLSVVERNTYRLLRMVRQLLDLARHDAGTLRVRARPIDLAATTAATVQAFASLAERQGLALTATSTPPPPDAAPVYLDPELFEQILGNLLSNALKFTPEGGRVTVRVEQTDTAARLTVADTGPGIPADRHDRIFERFAQGDGSATRAQGGAGIGLALARSLVEQHGGTLSIESADGEGAAFSAAFRRGRAHLTDEQVAQRPGPRGPARPAPEATDDAPPEGRPPDPTPVRGEEGERIDPVPTETPAEEPPEDTPLVLVVDDNPDIRAYVRSVLRPAFRVAGAATGAEGLEQARDRLPDVILADVMMPAMDGLTMTERLRADPQTEAIPVVMLTARAGTDDEVEGLSVGATDYVVKPFDPQVLEMRVRGALAYQARLRRRLLAELRSDGHDGGRDGDGAAPSSGDPDSRGPGLPDAEPDAPAFEDEVRAAVAQRLPDPDLDPQMLAEALAMSRATLYRRLKEADLPSPGQLVLTMRLERGAALLTEGAGSVSQVAYAVGFESLSHFSRRFADHFDVPPTDYRQQAEA